MIVYDYTRKSQEDSNRQVQSFEKQIEAIQSIIPPPSVSFEPILPSPIQESKTGKIPSVRNLFNIMMDQIELKLLQNQSIGIRCWRISRLARNAPDASRVIQAVQSGLTIFTPTKLFTVTNIDDLYNEFAKSHVYSNQLAIDVKEGMLERVKAGVPPLKAPIGYRNTPELEQGTRKILVDEQRFTLVQNLFKLFLTGKYNPSQLHQIATDTHGLRQRNGKKLAKKQIYNILTNIFYTGKYFMYAGELRDNGVHEPMITLEEFDLVQKILGSRGKPRYKGHEFAYTQWLLCVCTSSISATERVRRYCFECKGKFNAELHDVCPKCKIDLSPNLIHTVTYQCNRRRNPYCKQPSISLKNLEMQIESTLEKLQLDQAYVSWGLEMLRKDNEKEIGERQVVQKSLHDAITGVTKRLDNLAYKFTSEENQNGELYTDQEYKEMKNKLKLEKLQLETKLQELSKRQDTWIENAEKAFNFAVHAKYWFSKGTKQEKRAIFQAISSNPILENGLVKYSLLKPFQAIQKLAELGIMENNTFEPQEKIAIVGQSSNNNLQNDTKYAWRDSNPRPHR